MFRNVLIGIALLLLATMSTTLVGCSHTAVNPTAPGVSQPSVPPAGKGLSDVPNGAKILPTKHQASNGAVIFIEDGITTTVLGRYTLDMRYFIDEFEIPESHSNLGNAQGINILNRPGKDVNMLSPEQFWVQHNQPFIDAAIERGDTILIVSKFTDENLFNDKINNVLTGFGREMEYLLEHGYVYEESTKRMIRKAQ